MTTAYIIHLPWPAKELWANRRTHWAAEAHAKAAARKVAWALCKEAGVPRGTGAALRFSYHPPDKRRRDAQNLPATLKAQIDGIADAIGCDDSKFQCMFPPKFSGVMRDGAIAVEIEVTK